MDSEFEIITKYLRRPFIVVFTKCAMVEYLSSKLTTHVVREISKNEIYFRLRSTDTLVEFTRQVLGMTPKSAAVPL